jgi:hypothetical protein
MSICSRGITTCQVIACTLSHEFDACGNTGLPDSQLQDDRRQETAMKYAFVLRQSGVTR